MPTLDRIFVYPIKSLDGVSLAEATVLPSGALEYDRTLALVDEKGTVVNAKRFAQIHLIRAEYDLPSDMVRLHAGPGGPVRTFDLQLDRGGMGDFFSDFFGFGVTVRNDAAVGFPDDLDSPGPTLLAEATLGQYASWFPSMTVESMRKRLRANLHVGGTGPFWEDGLYGPPGTHVPFRIGQAEFLGNNPCQRCNVPARDPRSGVVTEDFTKTFSQRRRETLPPWADPGRFNHFFRAAVNTLVPPGSGPQRVRVGDEVCLNVARTAARGSLD